MKKIIPFFTIFAMLFASIDASSAPFQQAQEDIAKKTVSENLLFYSPKDDSSIIDLNATVNTIDSRYKAAVDRLKQQAASVKEYARTHNFSTEYCFLVDMSLPSGKNRFFVYNIKKDSLEYASLVAHGFGSYKGNGNDQLEFSNVPNSFKTSLGKYKVGGSYYGAFGQAYKLYGLDSTNNNAYERAIVLHSYASMPPSETYPDRICESAGCPMVNSSFLAILGTYIRSSKKPLLMWIYN